MKKLIIITGASSGIGEATARVLSEAGHPLLLLARRIEKLHALALPNALCEQVDVRDVTSFKAAVDKAVALYGEPDCLINNAGVMLLGTIGTQDPQEWQDMFDINVMALLQGINLVIGGMKTRQTGTIINIGSVSGRTIYDNRVGYCGSKFAVHAISEALRREVASSNVRVITIAPGSVETELVSHTSSDKLKQDIASWKESIGGVISSTDVANAIYFAYSQPQNVCIREIVLATTKQVV